MKNVIVIKLFTFIASASMADGGASLAGLVQNPRPWLKASANSEQRQPYYIGLTPLEMELRRSAPANPRLPSDLKNLGEEQIERLAQALGLSTGEFELWPAIDEYGQRTWAMARYRKQTAWRWLESDAWDGDEDEVGPLLPVKKYPLSNADHHAIFDDFLTMTNLYDKPLFGQCLWTLNGNPVAGWLNPDEREAYRERFRARGYACYVLNQPARFNGQPITFKAKYKDGKVSWDQRIEWFDDLVQVEEPKLAESVPIWRANDIERYKQDVRFLSGDTFKRKNNAQADHQLEELNDYLESRYARLGLKTYRQPFTWRGVNQSNLIAVIPGSLPPHLNHPVLYSDHIDTAFSEDVFKKTGRRESTPGADDNVTAVAALLMAAEYLKDTKPLHDIWLVHLTGEEFPADDLGAREFVGELLGKKKQISGLLLMDMIGHNPQNKPLFQINPGQSEVSMRIARLAQAAARKAAPALDPVIRSRFDPYGYLYNTDGLIFDEAGYPVVLFNEHINALEHIDRRHYHESTDTYEKINWSFAIGIVRTALLTGYQLSRTLNGEFHETVRPVGNKTSVPRRKIRKSCEELIN